MAHRDNVKFKRKDFPKFSLSAACRAEEEDGIRILTVNSRVLAGSG